MFRLPEFDIAGRLSRIVVTSTGFYGLLGTLVLGHFLFRGLLYPGAPGDDAEQLLFSQVFRWGYDIVNPPLYTWLLIAAQKVTGVTVWSVSLIKFPAYWLIFHFLYQLARQAIDRPGLAGAAALSPLWLYYVAWDAVQTYSQTVLATALIVALITAMMRLRTAGTLLAYILFGTVLGLGLLSKYTFGLTAVALLLAGLIYPPYRSCVLNIRMLAALVVAAILFAPHGFWLLHHADVIAGAVAGKFEMGEAAEIPGDRLTGMINLIISAFNFASPLWLVLLLFFWRPLRSRWHRHETIAPEIKLLTLFNLAALGLLVLFVLVFEASQIRTHYMFVFITFPLVVFGWIKADLTTGGGLRAYRISLIVMALLLVTGGAVKYLTEPLRCKRCQLLLPSSDIADRIRETGFTGGTIFAYYFPHDLAGNLRSVFPNTRIVSSKYPDITRPISEKPGQCLIIWMPAPAGVMDAHGMAQLANNELAADIPLKDFPVQSLPFRFDRTTDRLDKLNYMLFQPGRGTCR